MKKIIISIIVIGLLVSMAPLCLGREEAIDEKQFDDEIMPYWLPIEHEMESAQGQGKTLLQGDGNVELLWNITGGDYFVFSSLINNDSIPDILASNYAINGVNGEILFQFTYGNVIGIGDINEDGINEIFTAQDGIYPNDSYSELYCYNINNELIWEKEFDSYLIFSVSIGNVSLDNNNEVVVGTGDLTDRENHYVYCLDGFNGETIWRKHTGDYVHCTEIADVNADGENEVIAGTRNNDPRVYCLDGENGSVIWEYIRTWHGGADFRTLCIDDLNDDPYKEIVVEGTDDGNIYGVLCLSGYDGSIVWIWYSDAVGSFQSIRSGDLIDDYAGNEVIVGGVGGVYCLYGGNNPPSDGREIWRTEFGLGDSNFVMATAIGDLDKDNLLDVAAITFRASPSSGGHVYAINGQDGTIQWRFDNCGTEWLNGILCTDLTGDGFSEVVAKDTSYVCALKTTNNPANKPAITGPTSGKVGISYNYNVSSTDPDSDNIYYYVNWGDSTSSGWLGPYISGEMVTVSHTWSQKGTYTIRAKATDVYGAESDWGYLEVTMPKNQPSSQQSQKAVLVVKVAVNPAVNNPQSLLVVKYFNQ